MAEDVGKLKADMAAALNAEIAAERALRDAIRAAIQTKIDYLNASLAHDEATGKSDDKWHREVQAQIRQLGRNSQDVSQFVHAPLESGKRKRLLGF